MRNDSEKLKQIWTDGNSSVRNFDRIREYLKLKEKLMSEVTSKLTFKHDSVPKISAAPVNKF